MPRMPKAVTWADISDILLSRAHPRFHVFGSNARSRHVAQSREHLLHNNRQVAAVSEVTARRSCAGARRGRVAQAQARVWHAAVAGRWLRQGRVVSRAGGRCVKRVGRPELHVPHAARVCVVLMCQAEVLDVVHGGPARIVEPGVVRLTVHSPWVDLEH
eukprot:713100-Prymnesium_polylepis.1